MRVNWRLAAGQTGCRFGTHGPLGPLWAALGRSGPLWAAKCAMVHGPAPTRARELGTRGRADGLPAWLARSAGAALDHYGLLWAAVGCYGPLWAARVYQMVIMAPRPRARLKSCSGSGKAIRLSRKPQALVVTSWRPRLPKGIHIMKYHEVQFECISTRTHQLHCTMVYCTVQ